MAKMTKKEYTRKRLFFGVLIFVALALIITGIAIWLLFSLLGASMGGGITVAEVAMSPISFTSLQIDGNEVEDGQTVDAGFVFDSLYGDDTGRVTWNGTSSEKMSITVSGVVMGAQHLSRFSYILMLPQGVIDAAAKGYLDISDFYEMETGLYKENILSLADNGTMVTDGTNSAWRFNFEITIKWGERFQGLNPSVYFDTLGLGEPIEDVVSTLNDLHDTVVAGSSGNPMYTLTLTASPNN